MRDDAAAQDMLPRDKRDYDDDIMAKDIGARARMAPIAGLALR